MVDTTAIRSGQDNGSGSVLALYQTLWSGELIESYLEMTVMLDKVRTRSVGPGQKTASFPAIGDVGAGYHQSGENILDPSNGLMQTIKHGQQLINIDSKLVSPVFIDELDEFQNHYDVRRPYIDKMARRMARVTDSQLMQVGLLAAQSSAGPTDDHPGGLIINSANAGTVAQDLLDAIQAADQNFDEKDVPEEGRFCVLKPAQYNLLVNSTALLNTDFGNAGNGVFSEGTVRKAWGMTLIKSNHLPTTNISSTIADAVNDERNEYGGDFRNTLALCFHSDAIGHVMAKGMVFETERKLEYLGTLMVAHQAVGSGILAPAAAVQIRSAVPA